MIVLAIETATRVGSVALLSGEQCDARAVGSARSHAERLPGDAMQLLADHGLTLRDVDLFAVVVGPGSFTGIRVGVAAVQGLALTSGRRVVAVPTLEAIADAVGFRVTQSALVVATLDGHRDDIFFAAWRFDGTGAVSESSLAIEPVSGTESALVAAIADARGDRAVMMAGLPGSRGGPRAVERSRAEWVDVTTPLAEV